MGDAGDGRALELARAVHADYFTPGATIATSNSYAVHRDRLARFGLEDRFEALLRVALGEGRGGPMPGATVRGTGLTMWHSDIGAIGESEIGSADWTTYRAQAHKRYGHAGGLRKTSLRIGASLAFAWEAVWRSASLEALRTDILDEANAAPSSSSPSCSVSPCSSAAFRGRDPE